MELANKVKNLSNIISKYRYVACIVIIGIILLLVPISKNSDKKDLSIETTHNIPEHSIEEQLSTVLRLVDGAGDVRVVLSIAAGEEIVFQTDLTHNNSDTSDNVKNDTVTVTSADRSTTGLVKQIIPESFKGAVIVCTGADDPVVRLSIVDAVSKLTGLGANQISVLKMK